MSSTPAGRQTDDARSREHHDDQAPRAAGVPRLLVDGTIHSTAEPYAEAMLVQDGLISWIGAPESAEHVIRGDHERQELDRGLVAPAFVGRVDSDLRALNASAVATLLDEAAAHGQGALRLVLDVTTASLEGDPGTRTRLVEVLKAAYWHPVVAFPVVRLTGLAADVPTSDGGAGQEGLPGPAQKIQRLIALVEHCDDAAGAPVGIELSLGEISGGVLPAGSAVSPETHEHIVDHLVEVSAPLAEASRQMLLDVAGHAPDAVAAVVVDTRRRLQERRTTPRPDRPTVLVDFDSARRADWEALVGTAHHVLMRAPGHLGLALSAGIPTSVAPGADVDPWAMVATHVHRSEAAVSVRAAFNAQTRAAHRSLPAPDGLGPGTAGLAAQLAPGAVATYTVWEVESLAVQTPDARTAAWSTDARARTPLLPFLGTAAEPAALPRLRATVVSGVEVHGTADARHSGAQDS
ncbi:hypothetical protein [Nesterenkonia sp. PF2B19]|uniref:hypothetical protein n=1 Tax=Nesterenkonia sp. PF2B19 TaxID=1881858 RepID=UPI00111C54EE|nr:hypothetical protein [Nesterenkonia sp. PF2B19]